MRKQFCCIAAVAGCMALASVEASAQRMAPSSTRIMFGPFVGLNYTTVTDDEFSDPKYRAGLAAGGQLQADFPGGAFFRMAALYSMRGAKATEDGVEVTFKEDYIEFPLLLGYGFSSASSATRPFVMAGGQVGFKVKCKAEGEDGGTSVSVDCDDLADDDVASVDYGVVGGAGVLFPMASGTVSVDARYYLGLHEVSKDSDTKHRGFTFGIAYMIPFGH